MEQIRSPPGGAATFLDRALAACYKDPSPAIRRYATIASYTLRDNGPLPVATALLGALTDTDSAVRSAAAEFYRSIPVDPASKQTESAVLSLLGSTEPEARRAGIETALTNELLEKSTAISDMLDPVLGPKPALAMRWSLCARIRARKTLRGTSVVSDSISSEKAARRSIAFEILQKDETLRTQPAVQAALSDVIRAGGEFAESARKLVAKTDLDPSSGSRQLDLRFLPAV